VLHAGRLDPVAALRAVLPADRLAAAGAAAAAPTLTGRVARRGRRPAGRARGGRAQRILVTWRMAQPITGVTTFEVVAGGRTLAARGAGARGAWLQTRARRARITALDADGRPVASTVVRLR
jgi:hypothetical protein